MKPHIKTILLVILLLLEIAFIIWIDAEYSRGFIHMLG
jgi:hypothetical protein